MFDSRFYILHGCGFADTIDRQEPVQDRSSVYAPARLPMGHPRPQALNARHVSAAVVAEQSAEPQEPGS